MHPSQLILTNLLTLARLETELSNTGPRAKERPVLERAIVSQRKQIPAPMLSHHDRLKVKGRRSVAPVQEWICRACFISVPVGSRQRLAHATDLFICENCGAYLYLPDGTADRPADELPPQSARAQRIAEALAAKTARKKATRAPKATGGSDQERLAVIKKLSAKLTRG
ncbi:MAG: C4-type zinc ribbon domain-containing protein [Verrucomicrobiales bacterium]|jgi:hypothetical protein|nr:C4-type zinc ribbon domain-containing protein [Verrucomicrobiales bacterium]